MGMMLLRVFYFTYFFGVALIILSRVSNLIFSHGQLPERFRAFFAGIALALVWPLALFSRHGRRRLLLTFKRQ